MACYEQGTDRPLVRSSSSHCGRQIAYSRVMGQKKVQAVQPTPPESNLPAATPLDTKSEQERADLSLEPFFSTAGRTHPAQPSSLAIAYGEIDSVLYRWSQSSERIGERVLVRECQVAAAVPSAPPEHTAEALEAAIAARLAAHPMLGLAPSTQSLLEDALGWAPALLVARGTSVEAAIAVKPLLAGSGAFRRSCVHFVA